MGFTEDFLPIDEPGKSQTLCCLFLFYDQSPREKNQSMQALVLRGTELPLSLTSQEILESEGFLSLVAMRKTPV